MAFKAMTARPRVFVFEMEVKFYVWNPLKKLKKQ